jgi:hypothetical protein
MAAAPERKREVVSTAFALGGFAGSNLHGLGLLDAALRKHVVPDMVSCTSGQIHALWKYLHARNVTAPGPEGRPSDLEAFAKEYNDAAEIRPTLPFPEILNDIPELVSASVKHLTDVESFRASPFGYLLNVTLNNIPARTLAPSVEGDTLEQMAADFNDETRIGIAFNSYNPREGREYVYLNHRAADLLNRHPPMVSSFRKTAHHTTEYRPITPADIRDALWIYEYGFEGHEFVDGAYFRQVMLSELSRARTIFVARPLPWKWTTTLPVTFGEKEDLKTSVFFNAAYYGERFRIDLVNRLLRDHALDPQFVERAGYHRVQFYEVAARASKPFVGIFSESLPMFYEAREDAEKVFEKAASAGDKGDEP